MCFVGMESAGPSRDLEVARQAYKVRKLCVCVGVCVSWMHCEKLVGFLDCVATLLTSRWIIDKEGDLEKSRLAHLAKLHAKKEGEHKKEGGAVISSIVFGGLDGIVTTFAILVAAAAQRLLIKVERIGEGERCTRMPSVGAVLIASFGVVGLLFVGGLCVDCRFPLFFFPTNRLC